MFGDFLMYLSSDVIGMSALSRDSFLSFYCVYATESLGLEFFLLLLFNRIFFSGLGGGGI